MKILTVLTLAVLNVIEFCLDVLDWMWRPLCILVLLNTFIWMITKGYNTVGSSWVEVAMMFVSSFCVLKGATNQGIKYYKNMLFPKFNAKSGDKK